MTWDGIWAAFLLGAERVFWRGIVPAGLVLGAGYVLVFG